MEEEKRLLIFHPIIAPYRIDFFNRLNKTFCTRTCFFMKKFAANYMDSSKVDAQLQFVPHYIDGFSKKNKFQMLRGVTRHIKEFKPNVVLSFEFGSVTLWCLLYRFLSRRRYKVISLLDESYNMAAEGNEFSYMHKIAKKILMPFLDNAIFSDSRVIEYYDGKYPYKGIFFPIISNDEIAAKRQINCLPISSSYVNKYKLKGKHIVLYVGRLLEIKNIDTVIKAFKEVKIDNKVLVIVGDGEKRNDLKALADNNENIIFTGMLSGNELYAWYNVAQIFTLASHIEAFGAVTNEALQGGCYCLISSHAGSCCLIEENNNGNIIPPEDINQWIIKMENAFNKTNVVENELKIKPSRMIVKFEDFMNQLTNEIKTI